MIMALGPNPTRHKVAVAKQALTARLLAEHELMKVMRKRVADGYPVSDDVRAILARIDVADKILEELNDTVR